MPFKFSFRRIQSAVGFLCIALAWLFPYYGGGSSDAMQQFFMLGMFSGAALLIGIGSISPWVLGGVLCGSLLMAVTPNPYWGRSVAGVAGLLLLGLACQVGQHLRDTPDRLTGLLYAVTAAAFFNAVQGLLQWSDR